MVPALLKKCMTCGIFVFILATNVPSLASSLFTEKNALSDPQFWDHTFRDDTTPPVTTLSFDPEAPDGHNDWYVSNVTVTLNATDDSSGVNVTYYKINEGNWEIYEYPFVLNASNYYVIEYYSIDIAGNVETVKTASCKVDVVPPVTTYHIDDGNYHICYLEATDDMSGVLGTYFQVDGGVWQEYSTPFKITTDGSHIIRFYSVDRAGNEEDIQQITINHNTDTLPPTVNLAVENIFFNKWKFIAEASDADSGIDRVEFYVDDQLLGSVHNPGLYEWNWTCPDSDSHAVQAIAYDRAGNWAASDIIMSFSKSHSQPIPIFQYMNHFVQHFILYRQTIQ